MFVFDLFLLFFFFFYFTFFFIFFCFFFFFFFSSRRRHTRCLSDWSSDVCSSDLLRHGACVDQQAIRHTHHALVSDNTDLSCKLQITGHSSVDGRDKCLKIGRASCRERV